MGIFKGTVARKKADVVSHPADAIMLQAMAGRGELGSEARWVHHLFFRDKATALEAAERAEAVSIARDFFEGVAGATHGKYDGWDVRPVPKHSRRRLEVPVAVSA